MSISAIETNYNGCRFRSRLEARWAVFFDTVGIGWAYEPTFLEVKALGQRHRWLPDFRLDDGRWVEVKGDMDEGGAVRYISLAYFVGGCPGSDVVFLGPLPQPRTDDWPLQLHRCLNDTLFATPFTLEPGCPLTAGRPRLLSSELDAGVLLAGLPWGQPRWARAGLAAARSHRW